MTWPVPAPGEIADRAASTYEAALPGIDARSPNEVATVNTRITDGAMLDLYLFQAALAQELMPDTAQSTLLRHANIWGVPRQQPTFAIGNMIFAGTPGTVIPADFTLAARGGVIVTLPAPATIGGGGTVTAPVQSTLTGAGQNQPGGAVFQATSPMGGLNPQLGTLDSGGLAGGTDIEGINAWRARILARIRQPPNGGSSSDYAAWARAAGVGVAYVSVIANYTGLGNVGVIVAMPGPAAATDDEIAAVLAYINTVRPVTAYVIVLGATLQPVDVTLHLDPDTTETRAAAQAALAISFAQDATIGGTVFVSRLDNAVSSADGEYSHERTAPSADVAMTALQISVLGTVLFT